ncbi:DNA adenine methylase [Lysinibacillus sp. CNPSo 3705]|uniref:DNA adenine methylase n=1 Tax=Lysinibacillus sp. CNPSo 3705 TaxID=3028148 RepID=UPI002363891F|nr:DNA adenine methylase [Lysinibacillus sp. CNPSo 3705]MDD1505393.1 DNA adenine methylase [Lysinibacillus sp. CNPSo 3705]
MLRENKLKKFGTKKATRETDLVAFLFNLNSYGKRVGAGAIEELHLNDLDYGIYSLWWTILHMSAELIYRINNTQPSREQYFKAQQNIKQGFKGMDMLDAAWDTLIVNRLAYSGISKANPLGGKNGSQKQLLARWSPQSLTKRITCIANMADKITFIVRMPMVLWKKHIGTKRPKSS